LFLIDSDAFLALRVLCAPEQPSLLERIAVAAQGTLRMTTYVARHELSQVAREVEALEKRALLQVLAGIKPTSRYFEIQKTHKIHKGEAEALAWLLQQPTPPDLLFVSRDAGALRAVTAEGFRCTDVFGAVVYSVKHGLLTEEDAAAALDVWHDKGQQLGKPADFSSFRESFSIRGERPPCYYL
jgi:predicted nucleic acid-binding protein